MERLDVALATCASLPEPDLDEAPLLEALRAAGLRAQALAWDDPAAPFHLARRVVLRSTWNYVHHLDAFLAWVDALGDRALNPPSVVRWNHDKRYLADLAAAGVPVVHTAYVSRGEGRALASVMADARWDDVVAKPCVSAGSFETRRVRAPVSDDDARWFAHQTTLRAMMVQPYQAAVEAWGERSLVWIDGEVTHSIRKSPRFSGDDERVSEAALPVEPEALAVARAALACACQRTGAAPLYARIDLVRDGDGRERVMELELIEPSLFFAQGPAGLARMAAALAR